MPVVNIYYREPRFFPALDKVSEALQAFVANQLTCSDRTLQPNEVSVRLLEAHGRNMLAEVELDIVAAPYRERVEKQDEICRNIREFVLEHIEGLDHTEVWLHLHELGHSWQEPES